MIIISDTSPINYLVIIGEIDLLSRLFARVIIPSAVVTELKHPNTPAAVRQWTDAPPPWLEIRDATALDPTIKLGAGEVAAISLALEINADQLLLDDKKAWRAAETRGFRVTGTLSVLREAAIREWIDLPAALARIQQTTFNVTPALIQKMLDEDAERKQQH